MSHLHKQGGKYSFRYIRALLARARIEEVIGQFVWLRRVNERYSYGLCPFHREQSPSFTVSEEGGLFHCYGCGAFGDVVHFLLFYFRSHHRVSDFERDERRKINEEFELWHSTYTGNQSLDAYERSEYQLLWEIYRKKLEQLEHQVERELQKLKSEQAFNYLDAIRWLANRYRYWPSQHRRLEKRSKKI